MIPLVVFFSALGVGALGLTIGALLPGNTPKQPTAMFSKTSPELNAEISELIKLEEYYKGLKALSSEDTTKLTVGVRLILKRLERMKGLIREASPETRQRIVIEYSSSIQKINKILDPESLGDSLLHPGDYSDPKGLYGKALDSIQKFQEKISKDVKELTSYKELEIDVNSRLV